MSDFNLDGYVDVAERVRIFRDVYPTGSLQPADLDKPFTVVEIGGQTFIAYVAAAYRSPDDVRPGIGTAYEPVPGRTKFTKDSELQNAETAAWGRAIVAALAADTQRIASAQEVRNRQVPQVDPVVVLKHEIAQAGAARKLNLDEVADEFAAWSDGAKIQDADESMLRGFLDSLRAVA